MRTPQTIPSCMLGVFIAMAMPDLVHAEENAGTAGSTTATSNGDAAPQQAPVSSQFAKQIFADAMKQKEAGNLELACEMFFASYRILPRKTSAFQLASCLEEQGRTRSAQKIFLEVAKISKREGDQSAAEEATERAKALGARHSTIVVNVSLEALRIPGLSIRIDDALVMPTDWNRTRHPVDAGERAITASAPGHRNYITSVRIEKTATVRHVDIPALVALDNKAATTKTTPPGGSTPTTKERLLTVGGGSLAAIAVTALVVQYAAFDDWRRDHADLFRTIGLTTLFSGALGVGWGVDVYRTRQSALPNAALAPLATPTSIGFALNGHF